jgi:hypothetical protein
MTVLGRRRMGLVNIAQSCIYPRRSASTVMNGWGMVAAICADRLCMANSKMLWKFAFRHAQEDQSLPAVQPLTLRT